MHVESLVHVGILYTTQCTLMSLNLIKSSLMGKIQDQSVSTYVLDSLSVLTLVIGI